MTRFTLFLLIFTSLMAQAHSAVYPIIVRSYGSSYSWNNRNVSESMEYDKNCYNFTVNKKEHYVTEDTLVSVDEDYCASVLEIICKESPYKKGKTITPSNQNNINKFFFSNKDMTSDNLNKLCTDNIRKLEK